MRHRLGSTAARAAAATGAGSAGAEAGADASAITGAGAVTGAGTDTDVAVSAWMDMAAIAGTASWLSRVQTRNATAGQTPSATAMSRSGLLPSGDDVRGERGEQAEQEGAPGQHAEVSGVWRAAISLR